MADDAKIVDALVRAYRADRIGFAEICDEKLDRSGRLLGLVRGASLRAYDNARLQEEREQDTNPLHNIVI